ncbi:hypothetical protein K488DRAFT_19690, partial [Vararia minispora EC-137]
MTRNPIPSCGLDTEKSMAASHAGVVDNAFEEGQYDIGIASLLKSASPSVIPLPTHIRQLLYLALYPRDKNFSSSRHGAHVAKSSQSLAPLPATSDTACRALRELHRTLHPKYLLRALPSYPEIGQTRYSSPAHKDGSDAAADSTIAREAMRLADCRSCWRILAEDFIPPIAPVVRVLPGSPTKRTSAMASGVARNDGEDPLLVGPTSWPVLEWLVSLFEKDEARTSKETGTCFSPLLLAQIPATRSDRGAKWDATVPLDIVSFCLEQDELERHMLGNRLLRMLVNLTDSKDFDLPMFVNLVVTRFLTRDREDVSSFLSQLPS